VVELPEDEPLEDEPPELLELEDEPPAQSPLILTADAANAAASQ
jgi:hypothetical protein